MSLTQLSVDKACKLVSRKRILSNAGKTHLTTRIPPSHRLLRGSWRGQGPSASSGMGVGSAASLAWSWRGGLVGEVGPSCSESSSFWAGSTGGAGSAPGVGSSAWAGASFGTSWSWVGGPAGSASWAGGLLGRLAGGVELPSPESPLLLARAALRVG